MVWGEAVGFGKGTSSIDNIFSLQKLYKIVEYYETAFYKVHGTKLYIIMNIRDISTILFKHEKEYITADLVISTGRTK